MARFETLLQQDSCELSRSKKKKGERDRLQKNRRSFCYFFCRKIGRVAFRDHLSAGHPDVGIIATSHNMQHSRSCLQSPQSPFSHVPADTTTVIDVDAIDTDVAASARQLKRVKKEAEGVVASEGQNEKVAGRVEEEHQRAAKKAKLETEVDTEEDENTEADTPATPGAPAFKEADAVAKLGGFSPSPNSPKGNEDTPATPGAPAFTEADAVAKLGGFSPSPNSPKGNEDTPATPGAPAFTEADVVAKLKGFSPSPNSPKGNEDGNTSDTLELSDFTDEE